MSHAWITDTTYVTFDGEVLEAFGGFVEFPAPSARYHVANLSLEVDEPDRQGRRTVYVRPAASSLPGTLSFRVEPERWASVEPLLAEVRAQLTAPVG